jgi:tetratricopeptide (TPR) repeat protein
MEQVTVRIVDLLEKLKSNRDTHRETYELARDGYRQQAIEMFKKELALAENGWEFRSSVYLEPPEDHTKDYDNAIEMLEMALKAVESTVHPEAATIKITRKDFACYVRDDWGWKDAWFANTSGYTIGPGAGTK